MHPLFLSLRYITVLFSVYFEICLLLWPGYALEFLPTDPEIRVLFPALPNFLRSNGSGTGPLSLVSTTEELLGRKSSDSGLENRDYGHRDPSR
jgi:hypothetical protein